jgi:hypothetical protein
MNLFNLIINHELHVYIYIYMCVCVCECVCECVCREECINTVYHYIFIKKYLLSASLKYAHERKNRPRITEVLLYV